MKLTTGDTFVDLLDADTLAHREGSKLVSPPGAVRFAARTCQVGHI